MQGRTIELNLNHIKIAQCTMQAIGYLSTWAYSTAPDALTDVHQSYDHCRISSVDSSQDICGYFTCSTEPSHKYFIMACFDKATSTYSFHS